MNVKVYSTEHCIYCKMAKDFFRENNIKFEDINVQEDPKAAAEMIEKSGQTGVPVIEIDGRIVIGFNVERIKSVLKI